MSFDRRRMLTTMAAGLVGAKVLPFAASAAGAASANAAKPALRRADGSVDWSAVRAEFDGLDPEWTHLASFLFVSHPRAVRSEIDRLRARLDSDPYWIEAALFEGVEGRPYERARQAIAEYVGGTPEEIAFTSNTTTALAVAYHGLKIRPDQEIVTSEHDHFVHHEAIRYSTRKSAAAVRFVALYDEAAKADAGEIVRRVERALTAKTRLLGLTWVHSSTGVKLPIAAIAEVVARANRGRADADRCLFLVDGVHGFGNQDVDVAKLGADFVAAGLHKWFLGPRGTGMLWGRADAWPHLEPVVPSFDPWSEEPFVAWMERRPLAPTRAAWMAPGGFVAYEHLLALPAAAALHRELGRDRIAGRIAELNQRLRAELVKVPGLKLHTPLDPALAAGINCFEIAGRSVLDIVERLAAKRVRATASPYAVSYARYAAGLVNDERDLERGLAALREVAKG